MVWNSLAVRGCRLLARSVKAYDWRGPVGIYFLVAIVVIGVKVCSTC